MTGGGAGFAADGADAAGLDGAMTSGARGGESRWPRYKLPKAASKSSAPIIVFFLSMQKWK